MKKNNKKGFTIVELVIVIAVIAILAAVLIPTFSSIIKKAKVNNDIGTIANLNKGLAIAQATDGTPKTMTEVLAAAEDIGYTVEKLTPTAEDYYYCWNQNENKFFLVNDEFKPYDDTISYNANNSYWMIIHDATELTKVQGASTKFCLYFAYNPTTAENPTFNTTVGVDTGECDFDLKYTGTMSDVTIRTNGGNLTVESTTGTIYHYGEAGSINIIECDDDSFHTFAKAKEIKIAKGHLVMKEGSSADYIKINNTGTVKAEVNTGANVPAVIVEGAGANVELAISDTNATSLFAEEGNAITGADDITVNNGSYDAMEARIGATYYATLNEAAKAAKANETVYIIKDIECESGHSYQPISGYNYYPSVVIDSIGSGRVLDGNNHVITLGQGVFFAGSLQGTIKNVNIGLNEGSVCAIAYANTNATFEKVNVFGYKTVTGNEGAYVIYARASSNGKITFKQCEANMTMVGDGGNNYNAIFVGYHYINAPLNLVFEDCVNKGSLSCGKAAMFIGNDCTYSGLNITVKNFKNEGIVKATCMDSNYKYNHIFATAGETTMEIVIDGNKYDYKTIAYATLPGSFIHGPDDATLALKQNQDGTFTITPATAENVAYYEVSLRTYVNLKQDGTNRFVITERLAAGTLTTTLKNLQLIDSAFITTNSLNAETKIENDNIRSNGDDGCVYKVVDGDTTYYYMNDSLCFIRNGKTTFTDITVSAYDADGNLIASATLTK